MSIIHDFNSINRKLNRLEQKAEADKKNEPVPTPVGWPYGPVVPFEDITVRVSGGDLSNKVAQHAIKNAANGREIMRLHCCERTPDSAKFIVTVRNAASQAEPPVNPMIPASHPGYVRD